MKKGLFTSLEEITFQRRYVQGKEADGKDIKPPRDPNVGRNPAKTQFVCSKKSNKRNQIHLGRTRY